MKRNRTVTSLLITTSLCSLLGTTAVKADDAKPEPFLSAGPVAFGAFVDTYAAYDYNHPYTIDRAYTTQPVHENQVNLNLAMIEAKLDSSDWRGRLAIQGGDSVNSNYAAEKDIFWRYIQESSVGYKITDKLWIDGGVYLSHIGFESFNSRDNWTYTRSLVADYSPYYETGVKLSYQIDDETAAQFHVLRGWQNISNDETPAYGIQLTHAPCKTVQLTYANFIGETNGAGVRYFNDFIGKVDLTDSFSMAAQVDIGAQDRTNQDTAWWNGFALLAKYTLTPKLALGGRIERFSDPHQVVLSTVSGESFSATGFSVNIDYELAPKLFWRNEYRAMVGSHAVFPKDTEGNFRNEDNLVVTSLSFSL